jgi:hypothetical protein
MRPLGPGARELAALAPRLEARIRQAAALARTRSIEFDRSGSLSANPPDEEPLGLLPAFDDADATLDPGAHDFPARRIEGGQNR